MKTPVLFIGFNRPDLAREVLERLRCCGVEEIHFALDGPRSDEPADERKCASMRSLVQHADWIPRKRTLIRETNLGCGVAVSEAISWFFDNQEKGIIIEDDCLPDPSFFAFCESMLDRHQEDSTVWSVAGTALIPNAVHPEETHFFSKFSGIWGWATWRRAWATYSYDFADLPPEGWREVVRRNSANVIEEAYWLHILDLMLSGKIDTWDFQVQFSAWKEGAVHVTSSHNLVTNLGFRPDATHTKTASPLTDRQVRPNPPPYDPVSPEANEALDRIVFGEKLGASRELAHWLFGPQRREALEHEVEQLRAQISALETENRSLQSTESSMRDEVQRLTVELGKRRGLRGALRALLS